VEGTFSEVPFCQLLLFSLDDGLWFGFLLLGRFWLLIAKLLVVSVFLGVLLLLFGLLLGFLLGWLCFLRGLGLDILLAIEHSELEILGDV